MSSTEFDRERSFSKARELGNSTPLRKYGSSNYPEVISVVDHLFDELIDVYGLNLNRKSSIDKLKYHIEFFVLNLYKVYCKDPSKVIAYSRDRNVYSDRKGAYRKNFGISFRYSVDEGKDGKPVISFLERQGYIETFSFQYDKKNPNKRYQSRMRATPKLINLITETFNVSHEMVEEDYTGEELIVVKGLKPKPKWIAIVEDGEKRRKKIKRKRRVCKTPDKPAVREMRKNLEIINAVMEKADITLDITVKELLELKEYLRIDLNPYRWDIDFSKKRLHRVFLDRRLDRGGRFYGPWYQNIPKEYRQKIMIDGLPTLELDYSALHPNLLYYYAGVDPPAGDLYKLDGYSEDIRKFLKSFFLKMINSPSPYEAKGSIREDAFVKKKVKIPKELGKLEDKDLDPLIEKLLEKHEPLKKYIFKVKDLGNILQNVDSRIVESVLLYFAKKDIPVLPLHDSFRINAGFYNVLNEVMNRVIEENFGIPIPISDDHEPLLDRTISKIEEQIRRGDYDKKELDSLIEDLKSMLPLGYVLSKRFEKLRNEFIANRATS
ncbi:MAG: hypothetical protein JSV83_14075 [Desulfobacterales bacterium]|nr:MAG: hypothetical protein JSV83_14075 [Desulfobacterales bacterium]